MTFEETLAKSLGHQTDWDENTKAVVEIIARGSYKKGLEDMRERAAMVAAECYIDNLDVVDVVTAIRALPIEV